jgi:hypothetical protein
MQSKGDQMSPRKKKNMSSLTNVPFSKKKFGTSNEQQVSERHLTKKIETKK